MKTESAFRDFSFDFWYRTFKSLGWPVKQEILDTDALKEQGALPSGFAPTKITQLYFGKFIEVVIVEAEKITRSTCTRIARLWRQKRLTRPILVFTDGTQSYVIITPGRTSEQEVRILWIAEKLYHTDQEVINMMKYLEDENRLRIAYDSEFLPYEKVREEFFEGYRSLYQKMSEEMKKHLNSNASSYTQRFLGRLMFLYFLQRKGWLKGDKQFINKISNYKELNRLFYESLNSGSTEGIPFLNGSLFEKEEYMSEEMENKLSTFMDRFFIEARDFFNRFNFTVDESSPLEVEVSIDPALMGTVFENMLPENERGSKGTFYTPVAEISFICRRAIANYLGLKDEISPDGKKFKDGLALYLDRLRESKSEKEVREFREKLLSIRVLDPAVGSGGFLVVMMQVMIGLIQEAEATVGWTSDPEIYKKRILPNLYGFDIEPEAIEIARLRLWLSLIIDQKEPEPLPNLDVDLLAIKDSLLLPDPQRTLDTEVEELRERFEEIRIKYLNEHDSASKKRLKEQLEKISKQINEKTGTDPSVIEAFMKKPADVIVLNPPYVRQEAIPEKSKTYYTTKYELDKKSDLYAYFLLRSLQLLSQDGVVSVICSDKWLETEYGITLQRKLKDNLIAIYGQRERSFGADINTVVIVYTKEKNNSAVNFTYLESYASSEVRQNIVIAKTKLKPGKWFYLRDGSRFFLENILPKLNHKLSDFAEIRFGIKTGANEFFYMKDISHLYEADYMSNPKKFEEWGVKAKTRNELEKQGLIYVENKGGERFVIDKKDVIPVLRSPKEIHTRLIEKPETLMLYTRSPGKFTAKYIRWGENTPVIIKKGKKRLHEVKGYNNLESCRVRQPWYSLANEITPTHVLLVRFIHDRHFDILSKQKILTDQTQNLLYPKQNSYSDSESTEFDLSFRYWAYCNSILFFITKELFGMRMGGGGAALQLYTEAFSELPVPDLSNFRLPANFEPETINSIKPINEEIRKPNRRNFDIMILKALGFENPEILVDKLYEGLIKMMEDRLIKGAKGLRSREESTDDEDY